MGGLVYLMTHTSLQQRLQNTHYMTRNHALLDWLTAALRAIGPIHGDLTYLPTSWQTYAEIQQVFWKLDMKNIIYNMDPQDTKEELITMGMRNLMLRTVTPSFFGLLVTVFVPSPVQEKHK